MSPQRENRHRSPSSLRGLALLSVLAVSVVYVGHRTGKDASPEPGALESQDPPGPRAVATARDTTGEEDESPAAILGVTPRIRALPSTALGGRVVDVEGRPIAGAETRLGRSLVRSDARGRFALPLSGGELEVVHPAYFPRRIDADERRAVSGTSTPREYLVVLHRGGRIRGRVTDLRGKPIAGARVSFARPHVTAEGVTTGLPAFVHTDADGRYESPVLRPGVRRLHFRHPGYCNRESEVETTEGRVAHWQVALQRGEALTVIVRDTDGTALPDARVRLLRTDRQLGREETLDLGHTGDQGRLSARWRPDPRWRQRVHVSLPGFRETERYLRGHTVELHLARAAALHGVAVVASGEHAGLPIPVRALQLEFAGPGGFERIPDQGVLTHSLEAGHFRIGLPDWPGRYRVRVRGEGESRGVSEVFDFDGRSSPERVTVRLERLPAVRGTILHDGTPAAGSIVELFREALPGSGPQPPPESPARDALRPLESRRTDDGGGFLFPDLAPGRYRIRASFRGRATAESAPLDLPLPAPITLSIRDGPRLSGDDAGLDVPLRRRGRGVLVGSITAAGEALAELELAIRGPRSADGEGDSLSLRTDEKGRFRLAGLEPGSYLLSCPYPPLERRFEILDEQRVDLTVDLQPQDLVIRLARRSRDGIHPLASAIRGRVELPGSGIRLVSFTNTRGGGSAGEGSASRPLVEVRVPDRVIVRGLFPGRYRLSLHGARYLPYDEDFRLENRPLRVDAVLRPGFPVRLPSPEFGPRPPIGEPASLLVLRGDEEIYRSSEVIREEVFLPVLEAGTYRMTIRGDDGEIFSRIFHVE